MWVGDRNDHDPELVLLVPMEHSLCGLGQEKELTIVHWSSE